MKYRKVYLMLCLVMLGACSKQGYRPSEESPGTVDPAAREQHWNTDMERGGARMQPEQIAKSDEDWHKLLAREQYVVMREKGAEPAFTGKYWDTRAPGVYRCAACDTALTRWPSTSRNRARA